MRLLHFFFIVVLLATAACLGAVLFLPVESELTPAAREDNPGKSSPDELLAEFATYVDTTETARLHNIKTACSALDGVTLEPGEVFSFNRTVGPRTERRGYVQAREIVGQEFVPGVGGGVCQVSSTLYNAVLLAGMDIVERRNHSRPLGYVPIGRDATVYYGIIDFRFRNPYPSPVVISARVADKKVQVCLYGPQPLTQEIRIVTTDVEKLPAPVVFQHDPAVPAGQMVVERKGGPGYRVKVYRITGGHRELIAEDYYPPREMVIRASVWNAKTEKPPP